MLVVGVGSAWFEAVVRVAWLVPCWDCEELCPLAWVDVPVVGIEEFVGRAVRCDIREREFVVEVFCSVGCTHWSLVRNWLIRLQ